MASANNRPSNAAGLWHQKLIHTQILYVQRLRSRHTKGLIPRRNQHGPAGLTTMAIERCQRLGILYRKDGYMHLTARLWENADMPEVKAFALSLLNAL